MAAVDRATCPRCGAPLAADDKNAADGTESSSVITASSTVSTWAACPKTKPTRSPGKSTTCSCASGRASSSSHPAWTSSDLMRHDGNVPQTVEAAPARKAFVLSDFRDRFLAPYARDHGRFIIRKREWQTLPLAAIYRPVSSWRTRSLLRSIRRANIWRTGPMKAGGLERVLHNRVTLQFGGRTGGVRCCIDRSSFGLPLTSSSCGKSLLGQSQRQHDCGIRVRKPNQSHYCRCNRIQRHESLRRGPGSGRANRRRPGAPRGSRWNLPCWPNRRQVRRYSGE